MAKSPDTNLPGTTPDTRSGGVEGEGSYTAARDYQKSVDGFMEANRDRIGEFAQDAERALDGAEGETLRDAEAEAKAHARP
jgi:hypothetical protein